MYKQEENFFSKYSSGNALPDEIDDYIENWHTSCELQKMPLHDYLGLTWDEYQVWVHDSHALPYILRAQRERIPLITLMQTRVTELIAARAPDAASVVALKHWLESRSSDR